MLITPFSALEMLSVLASPVLTLPVLAPLVLLSVAYIAVVTIPLVVLDVRQRRLPNRLVLPGVALALVGCAVESEPGDAQLASRAAAVLMTILVFGLARAAHVLGMGDVKLAVLLVAALAPVAFRPGTPPRLWMLLLALMIASIGAGIAALCHLASPLRSRAPSGSASASASARSSVSAGALRPETALPGLGRRSRPTEASPRHSLAQGIPLGPFLLLGFWAAQAASLLPSP